MITLRHERPADIAAREVLLNEAFGDTRTRKTSERLREGRLPADGLSLIAADGKRVVGTARLWHIACASGHTALMLGPVAVAADCRSRGIGAALVRRSLRDARRLGHGAVILVGDAPYYGRFGFSSEKTASVRLPGPFERDRLLAIELKPGALDEARGLVRATGVAAPAPDRAAATMHAAPKGRRAARAA
jgi:predicted N-acetyltransferase YhbS